MKRKIEIFDEVVRVMAEDSATKKDLPGADPSIYRQMICEEMSEQAFVFVVQSYLGSFGILGHVHFYATNAKFTIPFRLRYDGSNLYVTDTVEGTGLVKGDCITHLGQENLATIQEKYSDFLTSKTPERQSSKWRMLVERAGQVSLQRQGVEMVVDLQDVQESLNQTDNFTWRQLTADTLYMKCPNFWDEEKIQTLYAETELAISKAPNLIIDVRGNQGGSDVHYYPLLAHGLLEGQSYTDVERDEDYGMELLYTDHNVDLRLAVMAEQLNSPHLTEDTRQFIEQFVSLLKVNRGKGFVTYESDDDGASLYNRFTGAIFPKKVVVLSDGVCASSGENFLAMMKGLPKVTVMGRASMGILDYSNCTTQSFDDYALVFPTSRYLGIDEGEGMTDKGIEPDIVLPWTVEHLEKDVDLEKALAFLEESC